MGKANEAELRWAVQENTCWDFERRPVPYLYGYCDCRKFLPEGYDNAVPDIPLFFGHCSWNCWTKLSWDFRGPIRHVATTMRVWHYLSTALPLFIICLCQSSTNNYCCPDISWVVSWATFFVIILRHYCPLKNPWSSFQNFKLKVLTPCENRRTSYRNDRSWY